VSVSRVPVSGWREQIQPCAGLDRRLSPECLRREPRFTTVPAAERGTPTCGGTPLVVSTAVAAKGSAGRNPHRLVLRKRRSRPAQVPIKGPGGSPEPPGPDATFRYSYWGSSSRDWMPPRVLRRVVAVAPARASSPIRRTAVPPAVPVTVTLTVFRFPGRSQRARSSRSTSPADSVPRWAAWPLTHTLRLAGPGCRSPASAGAPPPVVCGTPALAVAAPPAGSRAPGPPACCCRRSR